MKKIECEEIRQIKDVPNGEFIRLKRAGKFTDTVYVKDCYDRTEKKYCIYKYDDTNSYRYITGNTEVLVGFTF